MCTSCVGETVDKPFTNLPSIIFNKRCKNECWNRKTSGVISKPEFDTEIEIKIIHWLNSSDCPTNGCENISVVDIHEAGKLLILDFQQNFQPGRIRLFRIKDKINLPILQPNAYKLLGIIEYVDPRESGKLDDAITRYYRAYGKRLSNAWYDMDDLKKNHAGYKHLKSFYLF
ncbi:hypothetical protein FQA39_LY04884 [Lamprigera yunnana]|nr:hypothetical protein FQA39_LY04884 [Lamprigera yunnana]